MVKLYAEPLNMYVDIPEKPERIVSLAPAITETLFKLGLEDRVVGVSIYCNKPLEAKNKPRVGSYWKIMYNKLEPLNPDLILVTTGAQLVVLGELIERKYTVYPISLPVTLYGLLEYIIKIGVVVGEVKKARDLVIELEEKIYRLKGSLRGLRVHIEIDLGGPTAPGAITYITDTFNYLGASTTYDNVRDTWIINPETRTIIDYDPDIYIYELPYGAPTRLEWVIERLEKRGLGNLRAIKEKRLIILEPDNLAHYGPSYFKTLEELVSMIKEIV
ncbi:MAG: ABC transporter substrate-binding protein [Acidilobaceae archaeon]